MNMRPIFPLPQPQGVQQMHKARGRQPEFHLSNRDVPNGSKTSTPRKSLRSEEVPGEEARTRQSSRSHPSLKAAPQINSIMVSVHTTLTAVPSSVRQVATT